MIEAAIVTAIRARLASALAAADENLRPLRIEGHSAGWLDGDRACRLAGFDDIFEVTGDAIEFAPTLRDEPSRTRAMDRVARTLAAEGGLSAWRDERYAIAPALGARPWFLLERAAARYFGVRTFAVHINGLVDNRGLPSMWIARRSATKSIDPGLLDNLVGGGIAAGHSVAYTVTKEAWEEAGIPAALAQTAQPAGTVEVVRWQADGLQRETLFVHDLHLPVDFAPAAQDGEAVEHRRVSFGEAARLIACTSGPDVVTIDASLVVLDCLLRHRAISRDAPDLRALEALRRPARSPFD